MKGLEPGSPRGSFGVKDSVFGRNVEGGEGLAASGFLVQGLGFGLKSDRRHP